MCDFVVDARAGAGAGDGEIVDGDPGEDFGVGPRVAIGPVVEFFVDPGEEGYGAGGESVAEGLGFRAFCAVFGVSITQSRREWSCRIESGR